MPTPKTLALRVGAAWIAAVACAADARVLHGIGRSERSCLIGLVWDAPGGSERIVRGRDPRWLLECIDGDPTCDVDGAANGSCAFRTSVCVNVPSEACEGRPLRRIRARARAHGFRADLWDGSPVDGTFSVCGVPVDVLITLRKHGERAGAGLVRLSTDGDHDTFRLVCIPPRSAP